MNWQVYCLRIKEYRQFPFINKQGLFLCLACSIFMNNRMNNSSIPLWALSIVCCVFVSWECNTKPRSSTWSSSFHHSHPPAIFLLSNFLPSFQFLLLSTRSSLELYFLHPWHWLRWYLHFDTFWLQTWPHTPSSLCERADLANGRVKTFQLCYRQLCEISLIPSAFQFYLLPISRSLVLRISYCLWSISCSVRSPLPFEPLLSPNPTFLWAATLFGYLLSRTPALLGLLFLPNSYSLRTSLFELVPRQTN